MFSADEQFQESSLRHNVRRSGQFDSRRENGSFAIRSFGSLGQQLDLPNQLDNCPKCQQQILTTRVPHNVQGHKCLCHVLAKDSFNAIECITSLPDLHSDPHVHEDLFQSLQNGFRVFPHRSVLPPDRGTAARMKPASARGHSRLGLIKVAPPKIPSPSSPTPEYPRHSDAILFERGSPNEPFGGGSTHFDGQKTNEPSCNVCSKRNWCRTCEKLNSTSRNIHEGGANNVKTETPKVSQDFSNQLCSGLNDKHYAKRKLLCPRQNPSSFRLPSAIKPHYEDMNSYGNDLFVHNKTSIYIK